MSRRALLAVTIATATVCSAPAQRPWTLDEAFARLAEQPRDPYLQYVVLQLARRTDEFERHADQLARITRSRGGQRGRGGEVDVFDLFTGALAVQESLQLDTMRDPQPPARPGAEAGAPVAVASLTGPTIRSHPWKEMLGGRTPKVSPLSLMVPEDFYLVEFGSVSKMLTLFESGDLWSRQFFQQGAREAMTQDVAAAVRTQLAIETTPLLQPLYDQVVEQIAITGSDLYVREGSDVTLLFRLRQPELFRARMDGFLAGAVEAHAGAVRKQGECFGVAYDHVTSPDRTVHVFSAYPQPDLHVRSTSEVALRRVLAAIAGKDADGRRVRRLGETDEFAYVRTLMPWGPAGEDGFVYLSDALVRRLVGPQLKLTEQRRMRCYNHLRMIGHAATLHRTERGDAPPSLQALVESQCAPGLFGAGALSCFDGGTYRLSVDGRFGVCSHHGHAQALTPCCEIPLQSVSASEAGQYGAFLEEYNRYWRTFFDPIAMRVQLLPDRYRVETIVLPLIDNSIYTNLAMALGGEAQPLDALPVPAGNIFSVALKLDKTGLLRQGGGFLSDVPSWLGDGLLTDDDVDVLLRDGLGEQLSLNLCDADPMFDFSLPRALGEAFGSFGPRSMDDEWLAISFLIASLNAPVYVAIGVRDGAVVDAFLDKLDPVLARLARQPDSGGWFSIENDFYRLPDEQGHRIRCASIGLGPIKWRLFWARIGAAVYIASKRTTILDLIGARPPEPGPSGHAMLRIRPEHWAAVLRDFELGWAESNRLACLDNLGPLSNIARAYGAGNAWLDVAGEVYGTRFYCPENGAYQRTPDGGAVRCSVHGTVAAPTQPAKPSAASDLGQLLRHFRGLTATLTFTAEGLRAALEIRRK